MMRFFQPPVTPLPKDLDLSGRTTIVTGATSGIGLALAKQLLLLKASVVVLAVRDTSKGENVKRNLLDDPSIRAANPDAVIKCMRLDVEDYSSVTSFIRAFRAEHRDLHIAMLNAGISALKHNVASTGHEVTVQVNYLSNVLLTLELLPLLEDTARRMGTPGRLAWTGSRAITGTSLATKAPVKAGEAVLEHLDAEENFYGMARYADSKLLAILFLQELGRHFTSGRVVVNAFCPGLVDTALSDVLPLPFRLMVNIFKAVWARSTEEAARIGIHAAVVAGAETHAKQLGDKEIWEPEGYATSEDAVRLQKMLWNETIDEMERITHVPGWMTRV